MEKTTHSFFSKLMSFAFIAMGIFLGIYAFSTNATSRGIGGITWDNGNYLTSTFRDADPSTGDIITALYGSGDAGSVYTENWTGYTSGSCLSSGMNVVYTGVVPATISANTIYVIASGTYEVTNIIEINNCSALISSGIITLSGAMTNNPFIYSEDTHNIILENIGIVSYNTDRTPGDGIQIYNSTNFSINNTSVYNRNNGISLPLSLYGNITRIETYENANGLFFYSSDHVDTELLVTYDNQLAGLAIENNSEFLTFTDINSYNNTGYGIYIYSGSNNISITSGNIYTNGNGIYFDSSTNNTVDNVQVYNNTNGIYLFSASNNTINNIQTYNNFFGLHVYDSTYNAINNTQAYNNIHGIYLNSGTNNAINNIQSYNNANGISLNSGANNAINNVQSYNNGNGIYLNSVTTGNMYYGTLLFFANTTNISGTTTSLTTGSNIDYPGIFATGAIITTGDMSRDYVTNVINTNDEYLLSWTGNITSLIGIQSAYVILETENYSYGSGIATQTQPVIYSGTSLTTGGDFDTTKYIGSDVAKLTGNLLSLPTYTNTTGLTVTGISSDASIDNYSVFGNTVSYIFGTTINVATGIQLTTGDGTKHIVTQLYGDNYFATHFQKSVILDMTTPTFTGTTLSGTNVITGGYYNTGITITFADTNISGATLNGVAYTSGATITTGGTYIFVVRDLAGNSTGITFTIDTTNPVITGVTSGAYYSGNVVITGSDSTTFSGFTLSGTYYTGSSLTVTGEGIRVLIGYDIAGNSTGTTFIIDKTTPVFTGTTLSGTSITSGGYYNTGITITFADTNISGATLNGAAYTSGATITTGGTYIFVVRDRVGYSTGITFTIDTTLPSVTSSYPTTGLNYTGGNTITFTRTGTDTNLSGYTLYINSTGYAMGTNTGYTTGLLNGTYTRHVIATDRAGNTGTSIPATFMITTPFTGSVTVTGIIYTGYTNNVLSVILSSNYGSTSFSMTGNITGAFLPPYTGIVINGSQYNLTLTTGDGTKTVYITFSTGSEVVVFTQTIILDTIAPIPTLTSPASGATLTGGFNLTWADAPVDAGAGLSGYQYVVTSATGVILKSGYTTTAVRTATITTGEFGNTGTFYWYVKTFDRLNNSGVSTIRPFYYSGVADTTPDSFSFSNVTSARLNRIYGSNTVTITGFTANTSVLASVSTGVLYISGNMVGTTGYVQNGWTVKIELVSSNDYETQVNSTLTIGGVTALFRVTTMSEADDIATEYEDIETDLSSSQRLQIVAIFETLRDLYNGDKEEEFFSSLMVMLQSKIDDLDEDDSTYDSLKYLYDLVNTYYDDGDFGDDIDGASWIINGVYTAPNGKKYTIRYDSVKKQFTSTNFITPKYYPTLDVLKYDIDRNNPAGSAYANAKVIKARWGKISIDGTRQTSPYTAPNRKVFYFFKTVSGKYSSYTFTTEKYFDSLELVKEHIYNNNR